MDAICSSETSVDFEWTTRRSIPEDRALQKVVVNYMELFNDYFCLNACKTEHNALFAPVVCKELILTTEPVLNLYLHTAYI
jgi:hypothetical protein